MPVVKRPKLRMARFNNYLFPLTRSDFDILRQHNITTFRIERSLFDTLAKTLLADYLPEVVPFGKQVFPQIISSAFDNLDTDQVRIKVEKNMLRIKYYDAYAEEFNKALAVFTNLLGRFSFSLRRDITKKVDSVNMVQFTAVFDQTISPSAFYGVHIHENKETSVSIRLSHFARLTLRKAPSNLNVNRMALQIVFEDKEAGTAEERWREVFVRTFELQSMDENELAEAAKFFIGLTSYKLEHTHSNKN